MKNIRLPVCLVTICLILYTALHSSGAPLSVLMPMFVLSPFLVIWMVYRVLKDGEPSGKTFDEAFYDDQP